MSIHVSGKHLDVGDSLRDFIQSSVKTLFLRYMEEPISGNVVVSHPQSHIFHIDMEIHIHRGLILRSQAEHGDAYQAVSNALHQIEKNFQKDHDQRVKDQKRHHSNNTEFFVEEVSDDQK